MRIGVVSDTHGHVEFTRGAVHMLRSFQPAAVIHCGDIGSPAIVGLFSDWPTHFVLGNVDYDEAVLAAAIAAEGQTLHGRFGSLELEGRQIAFLHGDDLRRLERETAAGQWDLLCHGHTHVPREEQVGSTLVLNPGALYRAERHTIAVVELETLEVVSVAV